MSRGEKIHLQQIIIFFWSQIAVQNSLDSTPLRENSRHVRVHKSTPLACWRELPSLFVMLGYGQAAITASSLWGTHLPMIQVKALILYLQPSNHIHYQIHHEAGLLQGL